MPASRLECDGEFDPRAGLAHDERPQCGEFRRHGRLPHSLRQFRQRREPHGRHAAVRLRGKRTGRRDGPLLQSPSVLRCAHRPRITIIGGLRRDAGKQQRDDHGLKSLHLQELGRNPPRPALLPNVNKNLRFLPLRFANRSKAHHNLMWGWCLPFLNWAIIPGHRRWYEPHP
jgi:hypothetical protein